MTTAHDEQGSRPTVAETKAAMLQFGAEQTLRNEQFINDLEKRARSFVPWLTGGAVGLGLLMARGRRKPQHTDAQGKPRKRGLASVLKWGVTSALPIAVELLRKKAKHSPKP